MRPAPGTYLGIDPGLTGAIAGLTLGEDGSIVWLHVLDAPTITTRKASGKGNRTVLHAGRILDQIAGLRTYGPVLHACIERQQAMPASLRGRAIGSASTFSTGYGYGLWIMALTAAKIPFHTVAPVVWKRSFGLLHREKAESILEACRQFPGAAGDLFGRRKDAGRAEAALMALWGSRSLVVSDSYLEIGEA